MSMPWTARSETPSPRWRLLLWSLRRSRRAETWWTQPTETAPGSAKTAKYNGYQGVNPDTIAKTTVIGFLALAVLWVIFYFLTPPKHPGLPFNGGGGVLWKTTGYRMDDGWGINLEGSGLPQRLGPGKQPGRAAHRHHPWAARGPVLIRQRRGHRVHARYRQRPVRPDHEHHHLAVHPLANGGMRLEPRCRMVPTSAKRLPIYTGGRPPMRPRCAVPDSPAAVNR
jgi:hypothetical protein